MALMSFFGRTAILFLMPVLLLTAGFAADPTPVIRAGILSSPPFAMRNAAGKWEGISFDLWQAVASRLGLKCEYKECDFAGLIKGLDAGELDVGIGKISALEMHDPRVDFTHAYCFSGLAIAVPQMTEKQHWLSVVRMLRRNNFFILICLILLTLIVSGITIWFLEHRHNPDHFAKNAIKGIGAGLWWSATTITTVGYGDKAPVTFFGRLLAFFWMLTGITLVSVFTATITSMCTVSRLSNVYEYPGNLQNKRIGIVAGTQAESFLQKSGVDYLKAATTPKALELIAGGQVDMVIDDQSALKYYLRKQKIENVRMASNLLTTEGCSFILAKNNPVRDQLNQVIKEYTSLSEWHAVLAKYLGN